MHQMFMDHLTKDITQNLCQAFARNTNPRVKPKSSCSKADLIYNRVFADFLQFMHVLLSFVLFSPLLSRHPSTMAPLLYPCRRYGLF